MSTAIVLQPDEGAGQVPARVSRLGLLRPLASPSDILAVQEETRAFLAAALVEGRDYGKFPGVDKKSLFKAGAERSCLAFGLLSRFRIIEKEIDHDRPVPWRKVKAKYEGPRGNRVKVGEDVTEGASLGLYRYVIECELLGRDSGEIVGSAIASCSTLESKYIDRPRDAENTVLQMAEKRAFVAATRTALGLSEQFTQDIEDDPDRFAKAEGVVDDDAVKCPKCQGAMWDNRAKNDEREKDGKKRMPDYKCKDRECEAVIWSAQEFADELAKNDAVAGGKAAAPAAQGTPGGSATSPATSSSPATPTANKEESLEELIARAKRVSLMGRADSWDNHGGKPLGDCPDKVLKAAQNFFRRQAEGGQHERALRGAAAVHRARARRSRGEQPPGVPRAHRDSHHADAGDGGDGGPRAGERRNHSGAGARRARSRGRCAAGPRLDARERPVPRCPRGRRRRSAVLMTITASSRVCNGCGRLLPVPPAAAVCEHCGRVATPLHTEWPAGLKRWLVLQLLEQFWAPWRASTEHYRWERLLRAVIAGRTWKERIVPYSAHAEECFLVAATEFTPAVADRRAAHTEAA
jgi:hypothetical protein